MCEDAHYYTQPQRPYLIVGSFLIENRYDRNCYKRMST